MKLGHRNWVGGKVLGHADTPHSYYVELSDGRTLRRNQSFLKNKRAATSEPSCQQPLTSGAADTLPDTVQGQSIEPTEPIEAPVGVGAGCSGGGGESSGLEMVTSRGRVSRPPNRFGQNIYD